MNKRRNNLIKLLKVFFVVLFVINIVCSSKCNTILASSNNTDANVSEMWSTASTWFKDISTNDTSSVANSIIDEFVKMVNIIGTTVIVIATIILGIKYIIGSVDSKADVKEGMVTLLVACIFFFAWNSISNLLLPGGRLVFTSVNDTSYTNFVGRIFNWGVFVANIGAVIAIIYVGARYIFSGASGKADLKARSPIFIIGIILSFATVSFLTFLSTVINQIV